MEDIEVERVVSVALLPETSHKIIKNLFYLLGFSLNVSQVVWGINLSMSDVFLFLLVMFFLITKKIMVKIEFVLFFMAVICLRLIATIFLNEWMALTLSFSQLLITGQKFMVSLLYAILAMSVATLDRKCKLDFFAGLKTGTLFFGIVSLCLLFFAPTSLRASILFGGIRLKGFMNDPNYFAYLQMSGYCIWYFNRYTKRGWNSIAPIVYTLSIVLSASKTGFVVFVILNAFFVMKKSLTVKIKPKKSLILLFLGIMGVFFRNYLFQLVEMIRLLPQVNRLNELFDNFYTAFSVGGSGRTSAWRTAQQLITKTNYLGIGFVDYSSVATVISGSRTIAHNTFLQIAVEWGLIPAIVSLGLIGGQIIKRIRANDWLFCLLLFLNSLFSFSISLQNARLVWVLIGLLVAEKIDPCGGGANDDG